MPGPILDPGNSTVNKMNSLLWMLIESNHTNWQTMSRFVEKPRFSEASRRMEMGSLAPCCDAWHEILVSGPDARVFAASASRLICQLACSASMLLASCRLILIKIQP